MLTSDFNMWPPEMGLLIQHLQRLLYVAFLLAIISGTHLLFVIGACHLV